MAREIVLETVRAFGKIDIAIVNAGAANPLGKRAGEVDPEAWWSTFEVNLKGAFNYVRWVARRAFGSKAHVRDSPTLEYLEKSQGRVILMTSCTMNGRLATASDYMVSGGVSLFVVILG